MGNLWIVRWNLIVDPKILSNYPRKPLVLRNLYNGREGHSRLAQNSTYCTSREEIKTSEGFSEKTGWHFARGMLSMYAYFVPVCLALVEFLQCCVFLVLYIVGLCAYRGFGAPNACSGRLSAETAASIGRKGQFFSIGKGFGHGSAISWVGLENHLDFRWIQGLDVVEVVQNRWFVNFGAVEVHVYHGSLVETKIVFDFFRSEINESASLFIHFLFLIIFKMKVLSTCF